MFNYGANFLYSTNRLVEKHGATKRDLHLWLIELKELHDSASRFKLGRNATDWVDIVYIMIVLNKY